MIESTVIHADVVAAAVVAAARETGENPLDLDDGDPKLRLRHYALHALASVMGDGIRTELSRCLGAPGKASYFYRSSCWHVLGQGPSSPRPAEWWDEKALGRVVDATFRALKKVAPAGPSAAPRQPAKSAAVHLRWMKEQPAAGEVWNGAVAVDLRARRVTRLGRGFADLDDETTALVALLCAVRPAFIPDAEVQRRILSNPQVDGRIRVVGAKNRANAALAACKLEVREIAKMGWMLAETD